MSAMVGGINNLKIMSTRLCPQNIPKSLKMGPHIHASWAHHLQTPGPVSGKSVPPVSQRAPAWLQVQKRCTDWSRQVHLRLLQQQPPVDVNHLLLTMFDGKPLCMLFCCVTVCVCLCYSDLIPANRLVNSMDFNGQNITSAQLRDILPSSMRLGHQPRMVGVP